VKNKNRMAPAEKKARFRNIMDAAMPRTASLRGDVAPWSPRAGLAALGDLASLPGRAYASLGRPEAESYAEALARTGPTLAQYGDPLYQPGGDEFSETILRDPLLPAGVGLGMAARGLGRLGAGLVEGFGNAAGAGAMQYADEGRVSPLGMALAGGMSGLGRAMPKAPARASMISPEDGVSYRFTAKESPMSDWGHAMFADNRDAVSGIYGKNEYRVPIDRLTDVRDLDDAIRSAWEGRDLGRSMSSVDAAYYDELTPDDIADQLINVGDIVNTAKGYDSPLVNWFYDAVIEPRGIRGIKTLDGAVVFDPAVIKKVPSAEGTVSNLTAPTGRATAANPAQMLGRRLMAGGQQAVFQNLMGRDQQRGDTFYTRDRQ
jgi:hypothetical protein